MGTVRLQNVGKAYKRFPKRFGRLLEWLDPDGRDYHEKHWVLRGVDLEIEPGESVGIIGQNGAGKSTLLKIITGTTQVTEGQLAVSGRVAALLELGMGFHPEFSGRQNVFVAGQLLGMSSDELRECQADIEAFAEIADYIDQPVRTYSSGMQMRLAFSVATAIRPDVLIVDEALAVGDIYFQQKCYERIKGFVANGTTLLFVSHSAGAVLSLCNRAILLKHGTLAFDGEPKRALDLYQSDLLLRLDRKPESIRVAGPPAGADEDGVERSTSMPEQGPSPPSPGSITTSDVNLELARLIDEHGNPVSTLLADTNVAVELEFRVNRALSDPHVGFKIRDPFGLVLFETNTYCMSERIGAMIEGNKVNCRFSFPLRLAAGEYTLTVGFANEGFAEGSFREALYYVHETAAFTVVRNTESLVWLGLVNLAPQVTIRVRG